MPTFNTRGDLLFGVDRYVGVWWAGQPRPTAPWQENANTAAWASDNVFAFQAGAFTGGAPHIELSTGRAYPSLAASTMAGGGGRWVSFLAAGLGRLYDGRVTDPSVRLISGAGKHAVGRDGTLVYSPYQSDRGVTIESVDGATLAVFPHEPVQTTACLDQRAVAWFAPGRPLRIWDGQSVRSGPLAFPTYEGRLCRVQGALWVVYVSGVQPGVILHPVDDPTRGLVVGADQLTFHPDAVEVGGRLHVGWSRSAGERIEHLERTVITGDAQPWPVAPLPAVTRLCWRAIDGSAAGGSIVTQLGNAAWGQPPDTRPVVEGMPWAHSVPGSLLCVLVGTEAGNNGYPSKLAQIDASIAEARRRGCGIAVYSDAPTWVRLADQIVRKVTDAGVPVARVVQAYLQPGESAEAGLTRVAGELRRPVMASAPCGIMQRADPFPGVSPVLLQQFTVGLERLDPVPDLRLTFQIRRPGADPGAVARIEEGCRRMAGGMPPPQWPAQPEPPDPQPPKPPVDPPVVSAVAPWSILWRGGQS